MHDRHVQISHTHTHRDIEAFDWGISVKVSLLEPWFPSPQWWSNACAWVSRLHLPIVSSVNFTCFLLSLLAELACPTWWSYEACVTPHIYIIVRKLIWIYIIRSQQLVNQISQLTLSMNFLRMFNYMYKKERV